MRHVVLASVLAVFALSAATAVATAADAIPNSVVKILVVQRDVDFVRPWSKGSAQESSGTGVVIAGNRILTNAHVVLYASQIFVQADQTTDRVPAKVKAVAPGIDLAILEVDRPSFFKDHPAIPLADGLPAVKQAVSVYGYPIGGEQISVTQGIISRIEYTKVNYLTSGVRIQIDAALNPGNSGGPAIADGKIAGLVFSKYSAGENIGYLLAADEIRTFLKDVEDGTYDGKPQLWDEVQTAENDALRAKLGMDRETGVIIFRPFDDSPGYPLKKWDVITHIGGEPLDNRGDVKINDSLRLSMEYLVPKKAKDGRVKLTIFRDRKSMEVEVPVQADAGLVIPFLKGTYPRYFVYGPMIFMPASQELAYRLPPQLLMATKNPLLSRAMTRPKFEGEEIVTLGRALLPHKTSKGYGPAPYNVVTQVNGTAVKNMNHLVELLRDAKGEYLTVDVAGSGESLVFRRQEVLDATEDVLADEGIRKQYSDDLERVWHPKK